MTSPSVMEETAKKLGLRDPIPFQFGRYLLQVVHGDFGHSFIRSAQGGSTGGSRGQNTFDTANRASVGELILNTLPYSLLLAGLGVLFSLIIAVPVGIAAGLNSGALARSCGALFELSARIASECLAWRRLHSGLLGKNRLAAGDRLPGRQLRDPSGACFGGGACARDDPFDFGFRRIEPSRELCRGWPGSRPVALPHNHARMS